MPASFADHHLDRDSNLLFGVLCLQADLLDARQFAEACALWAARKDAPLADLLLERGWLSAEDRSHIDFLLARKLRKHGSARASLAAVEDEVRRSLSGTVVEEGARQSLSGTPLESCVRPTTGHQPQADEDSAGLSTTTAHQPQRRQRYTVLNLHARGGMGQVWLARDGDLGRDVALKDLQPESVDSDAARARFLQEAQVTGQLEHPGIVPVYELVRPEGEAPFYTMRFVKGQTLSEAVRAYHRKRQEGVATPLDLQALLNAFVSVCNAVAYAHARGVVHRDLKGQNVLMGDFGEVVVLDWGLAKLTGAADPAADGPPLALEGADDSSATRQGQVLGTPSYMAPEQAAGRLDLIDARTDVYGLGAILYEILTGRPPFTGPDTPTVLRLVQRETPARPRSLWPHAPAALEGVCLQALARSPQERYASARELADEVRRFLADEPVRAYRDPLSARAARWARRHRTLVSAAAVLLLAAVGLLGTVAVLTEQARLRSEHERLRTEEARADAEAQRAQADQARDQALAAEKTAREAVDEYFTRVSENKLLSVPGMEGLRNDLLQSTRKYYEAFVQKQADPSLRAELARAHHRLAVVTERVGSREEARRRYETAIRLYEQLPEDAAKPEWRAGLAKACNDLGLLLGDLGRADEAQRTYDQARAIQEELARDHPDNTRFATYMARTSLNRGLLHERTGRTAAALASFAEGRKALQGLVEDGAGPEVRGDLALNWMDTGNLLLEMGRYAEALKLYNLARPVMAQLARKSTSAYYQRLLGAIYHNIGTLHWHTGDLDECQRAYLEALKIRDKLAALHPAVSDLQGELGETLSNLAVEQIARHDSARAAETCRRAAEVLEPLTHEHSSTTRSRSTLGLIHNNLGVALYDAGRLDEALEHHRQALKLREVLARAHPALIEYQGWLADTHSNLGNVLRKLKKPQESLRAYETGRALYEALVRANPEIAKFRKDLALLDANLGYLHEEQGRPAEAVEAFQKSLLLRQQLVASNPTAPRFRADLAQSHRALGRVQRVLNFGRARGLVGGVLAASPGGLLPVLPLLGLRPEASDEKGEVPEALASFERARALQERLVKEHPKLVDFRADLARTCIDQGNAFRDSGRNMDAYQAFKKGREETSAALQQSPGVYDFRLDLATADANFGVTLQDMRLALAALRAHDQARDVREQLLKERPGDDEVRKYLGESYNSVGIATLSLRRRDQALAWFEKASETWKPLLERFPQDADLNSRAGRALLNRGITLWEMGRYRQAVPLLEQSLPCTRKAVAAEPLRQQHRVVLGKGHLWLARCQGALGHSAEAVANARAYRALWTPAPEHRYEEARALAAAAGALGKGGADLTAEEQRQQRILADEAVAVLRQAVELGFGDFVKLADDVAFDGLRSRADFQKLIPGGAPKEKGEEK